MAEKSDCDPASLASVSSLSDANSLVVVYSHQRRLSEISDMTVHEVLAAQKRSAETALKETKINAEIDLKRARMENHSLMSENAELSTRIKTLERRLKEFEEDNDSLKKHLLNVKLETQERISGILSTHRHDEELAEVNLTSHICILTVLLSIFSFQEVSLYLENGQDQR